MNKLIEYYDSVIERIEKNNGKISTDDSQLITAFKNLRQRAIEEGVGEEIDIEEAKKDIKDLMFESLKVREIEDKNTRFKAAIGIYTILDYKWNNPNSLKSLNEICKDLGISKSEYIHIVLNVAKDAYGRDEQKKRN